MRAWLLVAMVLAAPVAAADNLFRDEACHYGQCVEPAVCVDGVHQEPVHVEGGYCQASTCDPALMCQGRLESGTTCGINASVNGETCHRVRRLDLDVARPVDVLGLHEQVHLVQGGAGVTVSHGNATLREAPNSWTSVEADATLAVGGVDLGTTTLGVYGSSVTAEDPANPSPLGNDGNHTFRQAVVQASHASGFGVVGVAVGVLTLDFAPAGCFARTNVPDVPSVDCPRPLP